MCLIWLFQTQVDALHAYIHTQKQERESRRGRARRCVCVCVWVTVTGRLLFVSFFVRSVSDSQLSEADR